MRAGQPLLARVLERPLADTSREGVRPVPVSVVDSGIDGSHPDLRAQMAGAFAVDMKGDEAAVAGAEPLKNNDTYGHGTAVASIISRIAPSTILTGYRVLGKDNLGSGLAVLRAIEHAIDADSEIINVSIAISDKFLPRLWQLCERAHQKSIIIVASRRNLPLRDEGYPAALSSCIGVGNGGEGIPFDIRFHDGLIDFLAHGSNLSAAAAGGGYTSVTGTSFATPVVTGLVALLRAAYPTLRPYEIKAALKSYCPEREE